MKGAPVTRLNAPREEDTSKNGDTATEDEEGRGAAGKVDKTEPRRQRSLRAIIHDTCKRPTSRKARHFTSVEPATRQVHGAAPKAGIINAPADVRVASNEDEAAVDNILAPGDEMSTDEVTSLQPIFTRMTPGTRNATDSCNVKEPDDIRTIAKWLTSFKKLLQDMFCDDRGMLCDSYMQLLFHAHPELQSIAADTTVEDEPSRGASRRSTRRTSCKKATQGLLGEWDPFYLEMGQWVEHLGKAVANEPLADQSSLWEQARLRFIHKAVFGMLEALEASVDAKKWASETLESFTGGVSFIKESESHQTDVADEYACLPPIIIQPPNLKLTESARIAEMVQTIISDDVLLVRMPDRDDTVIKEYLLSPLARRSLVRSTSGAHCQVIGGLENVYSLIGDHVFLCFHYHMDEEDGSFKACVDTKRASTDGIDASNIQLTIVVRKGIGGTWALRNAARALDASQVLPLLTGSRSLQEMDFGSDLYRSLSEAGRKRSCLTPSGSTPSDSSSSKTQSSVPSVSVMNRLKQAKQPPVRHGTLSEWFASVQSTAAQIESSASQRGSSVLQSNSAKQDRSSFQVSEMAKASALRHGDTNRREKREKATTEFMQKTLKRRLPSCSNALPANIKIHTLSFRLEMFVNESLWKSLDRAQKNVLHSVVMGVEQWLHDKIQNWNRERMVNYVHDMATIVEERIEEIEDEMAQFSQRDVTQSHQNGVALGSAVSSVQSGTGMKVVLTTAESEGQGERSHLIRLIEDAPMLPPDPDCLSAGIVKASAVASSIETLNQPDIPWPYYLINTRDCFTYDLIEVKRKICFRCKQFIRTDFFFQPDQVPNDYGTQRNVGAKNSGEEEREIVPYISYLGKEKDWVEVDGFPSEPPEGAVPVGVTTFTSLFSHEELEKIEDKADEVHKNSQLGLYPPECFHPTIGKNGTLKRTKYFFGARYLWTKEQLAERDASVAKGVRVDVPSNPLWMKVQCCNDLTFMGCGDAQELVESSLIDLEIIPEEFVNSWALNMYHDGSEGIQSHFDDSQRFCQPIYSLRLFSDSRLSFGTQLYGFTNGAFYVPMPRGCITIMHDKSYAANAVKHCVRPCDMSGKSASLIMRKINEEAWKEAVQYHIDETTDWLERFHMDDSMESKYSSQNRKSAYGATKDMCRTEARIQADVKNVMEGLLKSVTKNASQEEMTEKKLRKTENKVTRQVMNSMIKTIEGMEKQAQKEKRVQQQELFQVQSIMENIIKRVEKNMVAPKRKRRDTTATTTAATTNFDLRSKREKHTEQEKLCLEDESVMQAANEILEKFRGKKDSDVVRCACALLKEYGPTYIQKQRQCDSEYQTTASYGAQGTQGRNSSSDARDIAEQGQTKPCSTPSQMALPVLPTVNIPDSYSVLMMQTNERDLMATNAGVREPTELGDSFYTVPDRGTASSSRGPFTSFAVGPHKFSLVPTEALNQCRPPAVTVAPMTTRRTRSSSREARRRAVFTEQSLVSSERGEEPKKLLNGLLEAVLKEAAHKQPECQKEHSGTLERPSEGLSEDFLREVVQETESVDIESFYGSPQTSIKLDEAVSRDITKRTYKLSSSDICFACEKSEITPEGVSKGPHAVEPGLLWMCRGKCRRSFHYGCLQSIDGYCKECSTGEHKCYQCGEGANHLGSVFKCSMGICGKYYHLQCVMQIPETYVLRGSSLPVGSTADDNSSIKFRCPQHYCKTCGASGANVFSVTCIRCPAAYHAKCRPDRCVQLSKKLIICPDHVTRP